MFHYPTRYIVNGTAKTKWDTLLNSPLEIQRWPLSLLGLGKVLKCFLYWWLNYIEAPQSLPLGQYIYIYIQIYIYIFEKYCLIGFPGGASDKEPTCQCKRCKRYGFNPWVRKIPWRRKWHPTPVFLPGKSIDRGACWAAVQGSQKARHSWSDLAHAIFWIRLI